MPILLSAMARPLSVSTCTSREQKPPPVAARAAPAKSEALTATLPPEISVPQPGLTARPQVPEVVSPSPANAPALTCRPHVPAVVKPQPARSVFFTARLVPEYCKPQPAPGQATSRVQPLPA